MDELSRLKACQAILRAHPGDKRGFCAHSAELVAKSLVTAQEAQMFRDWIHSMLNPRFSPECRYYATSYYNWLDSNHPKLFNKLQKKNLWADARVAWTQHLLTFLDTELAMR